MMAEAASKNNEEDGLVARDHGWRSSLAFRSPLDQSSGQRVRHARLVVRLIEARLIPAHPTIARVRSQWLRPDRSCCR